MGTALLMEYYSQLPQPKEGEDPRKSAAKFQVAVEKFRKKVAGRYTQGTLQRLLDCNHDQTRQAAVFALGMLGSMDSNALLAARLRDNDPQVRHLAADALWSLWFAADTDTNNQELQRLMRFRDSRQATLGLDALIKRTPGFAEAYNQRAVFHFRQKDYQRSITDCERVLKLNPYHFGALSGLAQCHIKMNKPRAALKVFRQAYRINPSLDGVQETIRALESALGEEGKKDDKK